jgi:hypothetical protein
MDFRIFLPSNVITPGGTNTVASYETFLPEPLRLTGSWEVSLDEVLFSSIANEEMAELTTGSTITLSACAVQLKKSAGGGRPNIIVASKQIEQQTFPSAREAISFLDNELLALLKSLSPPELTRKKVIQMRGGLPQVSPIPQADGTVLYPHFTPEQALTRSFNELAAEYSTVPAHAEDSGEGSAQNRPPEAKTDNADSLGGDDDVEIFSDDGYKCIFVYCDIVEPTVVGSQKLQLLRTLAKPYTKTSMHVERFVNPYYFKVLAQEITSIHIQFCTEFGSKVPFKDNGHSFCVLHFRPRRDNINVHEPFHLTLNGLNESSTVL